MPVTRGLPRVLSLTPVTSSSFRGQEGRRGRDRAEFGPSVFAMTTPPVMTHVDVGIVTITLVASRDIVVVVCVIIHTRV